MFGQLFLLLPGCATAGTKHTYNMATVVQLIGLKEVAKEDGYTIMY